MNSRKVLKRFLFIAVTVSIAVTLLSACGNTGNTLFKGANPTNSCITLYTYDGSLVKTAYLFDSKAETDLLEQVAKGKATPVADYVPSSASLPFYGVEIMADTVLSGLFCDDYVIMNDGNAYKTDIRIADIIKSYSWDEGETFSSSSVLPCLRYISCSPTGWNTEFMSEADEFVPAPDLTVTGTEFNKQTNTITISIHNDGPVEYIYGMQFSIDVNVDGTWYTVPAIEPVAFIDIAGILPAEQDDSQSFSLDFYGQLPKGNYRLVSCGRQAEFSID